MQKEIHTQTENLTTESPTKNGFLLTTGRGHDHNTQGTAQSFCQNRWGVTGTQNSYKDFFKTEQKHVEKQEMDKAMQNYEVFLDHYLCQELDSDLPMMHQECINLGHNLNVSKSNH